MLELLICTNLVPKMVIEYRFLLEGKYGTKCLDYQLTICGKTIHDPLMIKLFCLSCEKPKLF